MSEELGRACVNCKSNWGFGTIEDMKCCFLPYHVFVCPVCQKEYEDEEAGQAASCCERVPDNTIYVTTKDGISIDGPGWRIEIG